MTQAAPFFTIGHSNRSLAEFEALLREAGVELVADIRKMPMSRANPQFNHDALAPALAAQGMAYEHIAALGGRRGRSPSFHRYADYALSPAFRAGLEHLRHAGLARRCALMCAEAVWWRCHRRIVADYLIASGEAVFHIMGPGRLEPARLTPGAVVQADGDITYPAAAEQGGPP
jgi:uncharacterized protein (DUF488 family)